MSTTSKIILLADDDTDDQELLEEAILQVENGFIFHAVSSGTEVLTYLKNCADQDFPCLIILDYNMPDLNGAEVLEIISNDTRYKEIPTIVWSTSNLLLYKEHCERKGAKAYFPKPHSFAETKELARKMLDYCDTKVYP